MRTINIPSQTITEKIQSYLYNIGYSVDIVIGVGQMVGDTFQYSIPQQFDSISIVDTPEVIDPQTGEVMKPAITDYSDLMAQYPDGSFTSDDLWPYIDRIRARRI